MLGSLHVLLWCNGQVFSNTASAPAREYGGTYSKSTVLSVLAAVACRCTVPIISSQRYISPVIPRDKKRNPSTFCCPAFNQDNSAVAICRCCLVVDVTVLFIGMLGSSNNNNNNSDKK